MKSFALFVEMVMLGCVVPLPMAGMAALLSKGLVVLAPEMPKASMLQSVAAAAQLTETVPENVDVVAAYQDWMPMGLGAQPPTVVLVEVLEVKVKPVAVGVEKVAAPHSDAIT
jgi:hypothetical protein